MADPDPETCAIGPAHLSTSTNGKYFPYFNEVQLLKFCKNRYLEAFEMGMKIAIE